MLGSPDARAAAGLDEPGRPELADRDWGATHGVPSDGEVIAVFISRPKADPEQALSLRAAALRGELGALAEPVGEEDDAASAQASAMLAGWHVTRDPPRRGG